MGGWHAEGGSFRSRNECCRPDHRAGGGGCRPPPAPLPRRDRRPLRLGKSNGGVPVHITPDAISKGRLETAGPGSLRYDPDDPPAFLAGDPGSSTDMLLKALTDFRYDSLVLSVDGEAGGEMTLSFAVRGSNPSFYDGYPVALNLNVGGALDTILRRGLATYRIPSTVRERMMEFQDQNK